MTGHTKKTLQQYGLAPSKKRGQNFLVHEHTARAIVSSASFSPDDHVVEVGVGLGALTTCLGEVVRRVTGFEIDRGIIGYHREQGQLPGNVELVHADILKTDLKALSSEIGGKLKLISNLPYSISNPFVFLLIENRNYIEKAIILLQKEVADRLQARPGTKDYGIPTVMLQSCATVKGLMHVGPAEFHPRPKVESSLIRVDFDKPPFDEAEFTWLRAIVRAAFSSRRKTVINNLMSSLQVSPERFPDKTSKKEFIVGQLKAADIRPDIRAERIEIEQFHDLGRSMNRAA